MKKTEKIGVNEKVFKGEISTNEYVVCGIIKNEKDEYLVLEHKKIKNTLFFPSGKRDVLGREIGTATYGVNYKYNLEDSERALKRELREELAINGCTLEFYKRFDIKGRKNKYKPGLLDVYTVDVDSRYIKNAEEEKHKLLWMPLYKIIDVYENKSKKISEVIKLYINDLEGEKIFK